MRKRIFAIIQIGNKSDIPSRLFDYFITVIILLNLVVTFTLTFALEQQTLQMMKTIEFITMVIFTVEYLFRLWTADYLYTDCSRVAATLRFMISFYGIVDILTILPYWLPIETIYGMVVFRMIRVFRIFHLFRVNSQSDAFNVIISVLIEKKGQLLSSISLIGILMLSASFVMYSVEHTVQPEVFENGFSGLWWSVSTVLTVGYGDIYPVTTLGKAMAICISILGVMITAIPTGILSAGFSENYREHKILEREEPVHYTIRIRKGNRLVGTAVADLYSQYGLKIISLVREDIQIPIEEEHVQEGDILVCES
ncbi:MAG: ion transporter [Wujia sp.]